MNLVEVAPGVRLYVRQFGEGEPVVLIHGGSMTGDGWDHQVGALAPYYRVITYDFRGVGRSDCPPSGYSVDTLVEDLLGLIGALGLGKVRLVGYALGAHIALRLVAVAPHLVSRLALVSAAPWFVRPGGQGGFPPELWQAMQDRAALDRGQADLELMDEKYFHAPPSEGMRLWCARMAFAWPAAVFNELAQSLPSVNHEATLGNIQSPTLVVHGRHDRKNQYAGGKFLADRIPRARFVTMEESAHCPLWEEVGRFNEVLLEFLAHGRTQTDARDSSPSLA